jgi:hypothetical protein
VGGILGTAIGLRETIAISSVGGLVAVSLLAISPIRTLRAIPTLPEASADMAGDPATTTSSPPTGV